MVCLLYFSVFSCFCNLYHWFFTLFSTFWYFLLLIFDQLSLNQIVWNLLVCVIYNSNNVHLCEPLILQVVLSRKYPKNYDILVAILQDEEKIFTPPLANQIEEHKKNCVKILTKFSSFRFLYWFLQLCLRFLLHFKNLRTIFYITCFQWNLIFYLEIIAY